jgi:hypothetical protein
VRNDRLVDVDQREARHLDVLFLRQRQQQVEELALDLEDLDHLEQAAARGEHRARPGPRARVALIAELRHFRKIDRADEVRDVRGRRVVRRVGADAAAAGFRDEDPVHRHLHEIARELVRHAGDAVRAQLAGDVDPVGLAELRPQRMRNEVQR